MSDIQSQLPTILHHDTIAKLEYDKLLIGDRRVYPFEKKYVVTNNVFEVLEKTIKLNTETTDSKGIITFTKKKNMSDYLINGNSLYGIMQDIYRIGK